MDAGQAEGDLAEVAVPRRLLLGCRGAGGRRHDLHVALGEALLEAVVVVGLLHLGTGGEKVAVGALEALVVEQQVLGGRSRSRRARPAACWHGQR